MKEQNQFFLRFDEEPAADAITPTPQPARLSAERKAPPASALGAGAVPATLSNVELAHAPDLQTDATPARSEAILGAVLGAAIGDAIGHPVEFIGSFEEIRRMYPPAGVDGFQLFWSGDSGEKFAPYTDDTQMAEAVLRGLLEEHHDLDRAMRGIARRFIEWSRNPQGGHRAPGNACLAGCRALENGAAWSQAGGATAGGCGSVMRAYPFGLIFADDPEKAETWAVAHSKLTHRDPIALAASAAMAVGMCGVMHGYRPLRVASEMLAAACRYSAPTGAMICRAIEEALDGTEPEVTLNRLRGWAAHEAIAGAVYTFLRHSDAPRQAILEAANTPGDSDSLATLVGALVGARSGIGSLPPEWVKGVERTHDLVGLARACSQV